MSIGMAIIAITTRISKDMTAKPTYCSFLRVQRLSDIPTDSCQPITRSRLAKKIQVLSFSSTQRPVQDAPHGAEGCVIQDRQQHPGGTLGPGRRVDTNERQPSSPSCPP